MFIEDVFSLDGVVYEYTYENVMGDEQVVHLFNNQFGVFTLGGEDGPIESLVYPMQYARLEDAARERVATDVTFTVYGTDESLFAPVEDVSSMRTGVGYALDGERIVYVGGKRDVDGSVMGVSEQDVEYLVEVYDHPLVNPRQAEEEFEPSLMTPAQVATAEQENTLERVTPIL